MTQRQQIIEETAMHVRRANRLAGASAYDTVDALLVAELVDEYDIAVDDSWNWKRFVADVNKANRL